MGPIEKAIDEVRYEIPYEILRQVFTVEQNPTFARRKTNLKVSLDSRIREEIIHRRVLTDCNLVGGMEVVVPLAGLPVKYHDDDTFVVTIPKALTEGRSISSVLSIANAPSGWMGTQYAQPKAGNAFETRMNALFSSSTGSGGSLIDGRVRLIGDNIIYVKVINETTGDLFLRCRVGSDESMSDLPQSYWGDFGELVILATKAHVYTKLAIAMDEGQLSGGLTLGRFKEFVDEYRDANQMYKEKLNGEWIRIAALADETQHTRAIQIQFGNP